MKQMPKDLKSDDDIFAPLNVPKIYAYTTEQYAEEPWQDGSGFGLLKVGFTTRENVEDRISEQWPTQMPKQPWEVKLVDVAQSEVVGDFADHQVHKALIDMGRRRVNGEWFECTVDDVKNAIAQIKTGESSSVSRQHRFSLRPEQEAAVILTQKYFQQNSKDKSGKAPHFLWNAKMRFGKTFTTYKLAEAMGWKRILVLTFKPAVEDSWKEDLLSHTDFEDWQFLGLGGHFDEIDEAKPFVWFASFQDVLGTAQDGGIKERHEALRLMDWDCVVIDEYHFGAWTDAAKDLYDAEPSEIDSDQDLFSEETFPLSVDNYLYLSGTPFRSLAEGEFLEDQIFSWTYSDEQRAKEEWGEKDDNPYLELPKMSVFTYQMPSELRLIAENDDRNEFNLNEFFAAHKDGDDYKFKHEGDVQKFLDLLRGQYLPYDETLTGPDKVRPPIPFEDIRLLRSLRHTLFYLPSVASCFAMRDLMLQPQNSFYQDYQIHVAAGGKAGIGLKALPPVREVISRAPLKQKSITLSCGKLTTGVTIPEWTGIFMLRNTTSPESYFQAAFRVQSPWTTKEVDPVKGEVVHVLKENCYVFDFAPNRALNLIVDYARSLTTDPSLTVEDNVKEFLNYLPVLCFDGFAMQPLDAAQLLDFAATGSSSSALANRWQSARLINVGNEVLVRMLEHPEVIERLQQFESFRNLRENVTKTVNTERAIKELKTQKNNKLNKSEKKEVSAAEKEAREFRDNLRKNLIKLAARIPIFMYLTDYREETLSHVIMNIEPDLFKRVTGLDIDDFKILRDIGVFNKHTMNDAVFAFRRFENPSLHYLDPNYSVDDEGDNVTVGAFEDAYATDADLARGRVGS